MIKLWRTFGDIIEENLVVNIDVTDDDVLVKNRCDVKEENWVTSRRKDSDVMEERW
jgi:hypothetical protein